MKLTTLIVLVAMLAACKSDTTSGGREATQTTQSDKSDKNTSSSKTGALPSGVQRMNIVQLDALLRAGADIPIIDVRTPGEIAQGKIPGAKEMDFEASDFEQQIDGLERERSYILYCASGRRSLEAAELMVQKGFVNVFNLQGGYEAWEKHKSGK